MSPARHAPARAGRGMEQTLSEHARRVKETTSDIPAGCVDSEPWICLHGAPVLLTELLTPDRVKVPLGSHTKDEVLRELVRLAARDLDPSVIEPILAAVREREQVLSTGIGGGIAIPHGKTPVVDQLIAAAGVAAQPIDFDALDGRPVQVFFLLIGPESASGAHVKALSRISRLLRRDPLRRDLREAENGDAFLRLIHDSEAA